MNIEPLLPRKCRSQSSLEDSGHTSAFSLLDASPESRELTEPECDRGLASLHRRQLRSGQGEEGAVENISSDQLQQELNTIIVNYQKEKLKRSESSTEVKKYMISV